MDQFEFTKIAGAVLAALLLIVGTKTFIEMNVGHTPEKPGFQLPAPTAEAAKPANGAAGEAGAPAAATPEAAGKEVVALLPKANAAERQVHLQEMSRLPRLPRRARRRPSVPISGASSTARKRLIQGSPIPRP